MATKLAMTVTVKAMDTQRWICRIQWLQFNGTSLEDQPRERRASTGSLDPGEQVDELSAHHLPAVAGAGEVLLLVRLEARLHDEEPRPRRRRREREGHDGVEEGDAPCVAELPVRFDLEKPAVHDAVPPRVGL